MSPMPRRKKCTLPKSNSPQASSPIQRRKSNSPPQSENYALFKRKSISLFLLLGKPLQRHLPLFWSANTIKVHKEHQIFNLFTFWHNPTVGPNKLDPGWSGHDGMKTAPQQKNLLQHFNYTPTPLCSLLRWKHSQLAHNQHRYENSAAPNNERWCRLCCMCWYIEQSETNFPLLLSTHSKRFSAPISGCTKADTSRLFVGGLLGRGGWQKPTQFNEKLHSPILCD